MEQNRHRSYGVNGSRVAGRDCILHDSTHVRVGLRVRLGLQDSAWIGHRVKPRYISGYQILSGQSGK